MKVLLVSPNRERIPDPVFPLGLAYIAGALKKHGHEVAVLDLCFEPDMKGAIEKSIRENQPRIIGLSIRNIDDVSWPKCVSYIDLYRNIVSHIRENTDAPIVLGGAGLTIMPEAFMSTLGGDYAIVGESEQAFPDLVNALEAGRAPSERIIRSAGPLDVAAWGALDPDRTLFQIDEYYQHGGMLNIQTKRGCPFKCIYCSYPLIEGRTLRMRDPEAVADELEQLVSSTGVRHFFIVDSIFNHPVEHAGRICDAIVRRGLDIRWTCYGNPAFMTEDLAGKMRRAGCTSIEFGTDSMMDDTLEILQKGFSFKDIEKASEICRQADIKICHFMFLGAPGETEEKVKVNMERLEGLGADVSVIMTGIRIFPDTPLVKIAREELGLRSSDISLEPVYYIAPGVLKNMDGIVDHIKQNHPKWILPGFEININEKIQMILRKAGIKGSLWEEFLNR